MSRVPHSAPDLHLPPMRLTPPWRVPLFALVAAVLVALATIYVTR